MDNTALMLQLLKRLKVEMNGAVTGAMQERGIVYPLNYGVSVPTIRDIAREYGPNHSLALLLYQQQVRELKLAALFVDDPTSVTIGQVEEWSRDFTNPEIVELTVMYLFSRATAAVDKIADWLASNDHYLQYAGLLMLLRVACGPLCEETRTKMLLQRADQMLSEHELEPLLIRGAVNAFSRCAMLSSEMQNVLTDIAKRYADSQSPQLRELSSEVMSMLPVE